MWNVKKLTQVFIQKQEVWKIQAWLAWISTTSNFIYGGAKKADHKESKEDVEQPLPELSSTHRSS